MSFYKFNDFNEFNGFYKFNELSPFCCKPIKLTKLIKQKNKRPRRRL